MSEIAGAVVAESRGGKSDHGDSRRVANRKTDNRGKTLSLKRVAIF